MEQSEARLVEVVRLGISEYEQRESTHCRQELYGRVWVEIGLVVMKLQSRLAQLRYLTIVQAIRLKLDPRR